MELPESITGDWPRPHDEEPESLRDDIIAELSDHLQCALRRERHRTADARAAWQAVLSRFGDPRRVARQLWFENMKEQIMRQRITMALLGLAVAACFAALGLAWMSFSQLRASNEVLLAKLTALTASSGEPAGTVGNWTALRVRLVQEGTDNVPAEGFTVQLEGKAVNPTDAIVLKETTGEDGSVKFGPILPGKYALTIESPWKTARRNTFVLLPADEHVKTVVCPTTGPGEARVSCQVNWPHELKERGLFDDATVRLELTPTYEATIDGATWYYSEDETLRFNVDGQISSRGSSAPAQDRYVLLPAISYRPRSLHMMISVRGRDYSFSAQPNPGTSFEASDHENHVWQVELPHDNVKKLRQILGTRSLLENSEYQTRYHREILERLGASLQDIEGVKFAFEPKDVSLAYNGDPSPEAPILVPERCIIQVVVPEAYVRQVWQENFPGDGEPDEQQLAKTLQRVDDEVQRIVAEAIPDVRTSCELVVGSSPDPIAEVHEKAD